MDSSVCTTCVSTHSSSASWRTWSVTMDRYRSHTSCPKTSWRYSINPTKHQRRVKGRIEDLYFYLLSLWNHKNTDFQDLFICMFYHFNTHMYVCFVFILYVVLITVQMKGPSIWMQVMWTYNMQGILQYVLICLIMTESQSNCSFILNITFVSVHSAQT